MVNKALVLFASPHADGPTHRLLDAFLSGLSPERWTVETRNVCKEPAAPCMACGYCKRADGCALHDLDGFDAALHPHCLRHSYVTHLIEDGFDPLFVQQQVGHRWGSTTALYTGVSGDYRNRTLRRALDAAFTPPTATEEGSR